MLRSGPEYKIYKNLWYHNGKWYALTDGSVARGTIDEGLSVNTYVALLPVTHVQEFMASVPRCAITGPSLYVDFPFPAYPDNLGHMAEIMLPTYSVMLEERWARDLDVQPPLLQQILLGNLRTHLFDWFKAMLIVATSPAQEKPGTLPRLIDEDSISDFQKLGWIMVESLVVVRDRYTHPQRLQGFVSPEHGDLWRHGGCARYIDSSWRGGVSSPDHAEELRGECSALSRWPEPPGWTPGQPPPIPRMITLMMYPEDHPQVVNIWELLDTLRDVGDELGWDVQILTMTMESPFTSHVATAASTGLLVARHGPLLANALLLPPGAAVLELLPYKWEWHGMSRLYYNLTRSTGAIHHWALRAMSRDQAVYKPGDERYHTWTSEECHSRECLVVHEKAGLLVELDAVKALLRNKLPQLLQGRSVQDLQEPWPAPE